jgi:hypothetical protein
MQKIITSTLALFLSPILFAQQEPQPRAFPPLTLLEYCRGLNSGAGIAINYVTGEQKNSTDTSCQFVEAIGPASSYTVPDSMSPLIGSLTIYHYFSDRTIYDAIRFQKRREGYFSNLPFSQKLFSTKFQDSSNAYYPGLYYSFNPIDYKPHYGPYVLILKIRPPENFLMPENVPCEMCGMLSLMAAEKSKVGFLTVFNMGVLIDFSLIESFEVLDTSKRRVWKKVLKNFLHKDATLADFVLNREYACADKDSSPHVYFQKEPLERLMNTLKPYKDKFPAAFESLEECYKKSNIISKKEHCR